MVISHSIEVRKERRFKRNFIIYLCFFQGAAFEGEEDILVGGDVGLVGEKRRTKGAGILKELEKNRSRKSLEPNLSTQISSPRLGDDEEGKGKVRVRTSGREKSRVSEQDRKARRIGSDRESGRESERGSERGSEREAGRESERGSEKERSERETERDLEEGRGSDLTFFSFHESMNPSGTKSPYSIQKLNGLIEKEVRSLFCIISENNSYNNDNNNSNNQNNN